MILTLSKKGLSGLKQEKWTPPLNSAYFDKSRCQILPQTDNFDFLNQICPKRAFPHENKISEHHHWIHFKQTILNFATKFAQKGISGSKQKKGKWQFWFFEPNLPKKDVSVQKQKEWTLPTNSAYSN